MNSAQRQDSRLSGPPRKPYVNSRIVRYIMIFERVQDFYDALAIIPLNQMCGMTILIYAMGIVFGGVGSLLGALIAKRVVCYVTPTKWKARTAFWGMFAVLFAWALWALFVPSVNFRIKSISPDGSRSLYLEDVTRELSYEEIGWRLKAHLEDTKTGRCLGRMVIRHWNTSFDDVPHTPPTPADVRVIWSKDGRSALVEFGWVCGILPEGTSPERNPYAPEIIERFQIPITEE